MSVDLFCYAADLSENVNEKLELLRVQFPELFASKFLMYDAEPASVIHRGIALEQHFRANSWFLVSLNDKDSSHLVLSVAGKLKGAFGSENLIVLHTNETSI
jgi:hypothetical protein